MGTVTWLLKKERLLRVYYRDKLRGYRLGRRARTALLFDNPERFSFYLTGNVDTSLLKSSDPLQVYLGPNRGVTDLLVSETLRSMWRC